MEKEQQIFKRFTHNFLNSGYKERWDNLFNLGKKHWKKIDIWDLWEKDFCKEEAKIYEWKLGVDRLFDFIHSNMTSGKLLVIGLGHSFPFSEFLTLPELKENLYKLLEGLILFEGKDIGIAFNHDGDIMVFESKK